MSDLSIDSLYYVEWDYSRMTLCRKWDFFRINNNRMNKGIDGTGIISVEGH